MMLISYDLETSETKTLASTPLEESYYPYLNHPQQISLATNKVVYLRDFPEHSPRVYVSNLDDTEKQMVLDTASLPLSVQYINLSGPFNFLIQSTGVYE